MAEPPPNRPPDRLPESRPGGRGAWRVTILGLAGLGILAAAAWLGLRAPPAPAPQLAASATAIPPPASPAPAPPAPALVAPALVAPPQVTAPMARPTTPAQTAPAPLATAPPAAPAPLAAPPPRFDIVRVTPQGGTVLAGRAPPEAEIILRANGQEIGRARADAQGQWVLADARPLTLGTQEITVATRDANGHEIAGDAAVLAVVPERPAPATGTTAPPTMPLVVLTTPRGAPMLLQAPGRATGPVRLALDVVDYDDAGEIRFAGTALSGTTVRVYIDDAFVGDALAGADGRWTLLPRAAVAAGDHRLRIDQIDRAGRVAGRIEHPFQRAVVAAIPAGSQRVVVQPAQNLWRIARRAYGQGVRYTEIFAANRAQISNPDRIYPGQVFTIPGASTPISPSTSR